MDHAQDVERLFSWLKAPMVHYREFAPQIEVAEAVATWPIVHKAAVQTGVAAASEPGPRGDIAARERIARERMVMPAVAAQALRESPPPGTPPAPAAAAADQPSGDGFVAAIGLQLQAEHAMAAAEPEPQPTPRAGAAPSRAPAEPVITGFEAVAADAPAAPPEPHDVQGLTAPAPRQVGDRNVLFGGEYRERDREARPSPRVADRQERSLDAVFSRLSGGHDRLPDPRVRARTTPGLGAVFGRLR